MKSLWHLANLNHPYPILDHDTHADVVVIGAGITGLSTALRLAEEGLSVVILESGTVAGGSTGGSTGNLYSTLSAGLVPVREKWGDDVLREVVEARREALDEIERTVTRLGNDCDFHRRPLYRVAASPADDTTLSNLNREKEAHQAAGLETGPLDARLGTITLQNGFKIADQAQFNPLRYTQALADAATARGVRIFEYSRAKRIEWKGTRVECERGAVRTDQVVHASHTPKGINLTQTAMTASLEYGTAVEVSQDTGADGIFWITNDQCSIRNYHHEGADYLIAVGEKHKTGEPVHDDNCNERLFQYLRRHFPGASSVPTHRWSAQQFSAPDGLPWIGPSPVAPNQYIATGFGADGLVWGVLAGGIISDAIVGKENRWAERFSSRRFTLAKSARGWGEENLHVGKHMLHDHLGKTPDDDGLDDLPAGCGRVVRRDGDKVAVYRDENGALSAVSAICPHMKCVVHWNDTSKTWDCPCHGSRFGVSGEVLDGPACQPLRPHE